MKTGDSNSDLRHWLDGDPARCVIGLDDSRYPARLREIADPPRRLYCHGDVTLLGRPQVAIVGARAATPQGLETAQAFAGELARRGIVVTSGLALGIDGAAHRGALAAGGPTIAVCGTGLDRTYPAQHRELGREIAARGLLVSELPLGAQPLPHHFPRRNRIISGLALGVLVVEAAPQSGSLGTARCAMEQGREVFAIPGSIHSPTSRGVHALIRAGAKLTETVHDILEEVAAPGALDYAPPRAAAGPALDPVQRRVLDALGYDPTPFDQLVERLALPIEPLSEALVALELQGIIAATVGGGYQRIGGNGVRPRPSPAASTVDLKAGV